MAHGYICLHIILAAGSGFINNLTQEPVASGRMIPLGMECAWHGFPPPCFVVMLFFPTARKQMSSRSESMVLKRFTAVGREVFRYDLRGTNMRLPRPHEASCRLRKAWEFKPFRRHMG